MTDHITIPRTLLVQAMNALLLPCDRWNGQQFKIVTAAAEAIRAELAKPVERVEPITLDQFRAIANRTATTYRHRSDPEKSSYAFVDGSSLDDFWRKVCEAIQPTPAWNDAPEVAALKAERERCAKVCDAIAEDKWALYKGRAPYTGKEPGRASDYTQGQSDGADQCADAIRKVE